MSFIKISIACTSAKGRYLFFLNICVSRCWRISRISSKLLWIRQQCLVHLSFLQNLFTRFSEFCKTQGQFRNLGYLQMVKKKKKKHILYFIIFFYHGNNCKINRPSMMISFIDWIHDLWQYSIRNSSNNMFLHLLASPVFLAKIIDLVLTKKKHACFSIRNSWIRHKKVATKL